MADDYCYGQVSAFRRGGRAGRGRPRGDKTLVAAYAADRGVVAGGACRRAVDDAGRVGNRRVCGGHYQGAEGGHAGRCHGHCGHGVGRRGFMGGIHNLIRHVRHAS